MGALLPSEFPRPISPTSYHASAPKTTVAAQKPTRTAAQVLVSDFLIFACLFLNFLV
jgi:hypothetical protein